MRHETPKPRFKAGDQLQLRGADGPVLTFRRWGQYGDDCQVIFFNRHADGLGNVTWTPHELWLHPAMLEPIPTT